MNCTGRIQNGIYNCYGAIDDSLCHDCIHNADSDSKNKQNRFIDYRDKIDILYKYLMGIELPEGVRCKMPKLSADKAFTVIWFLQEIMHCLPDNIEQCDGCKQLFDTDSEGIYIDDQWKYKSNGKTVGRKHWGHFCEGCYPNIEIEVK